MCPTDGPAFHLFLPQMRMTHEAIVARARTAESAGFEGIAFMDHLAPPLAFDQEMWEAMSIASWVLAHTTDLVVGHLVLCDGLRHPAVLARQAVSLDHASGGRFELGLGWGSVPAELATFGVSQTDARARVGRLAESLAIIRKLWTGEIVDHDGEHFHLTGAQQRPMPTHRIPVTVGGVGPRTLALVREFADWWNVPVHELDRLDDLRGEVGSVRISVQLMVALARSEADIAQVTGLMERRFGGSPLRDRIEIGTSKQLAVRVRELQGRGVERLYIWFADFAPVDTLERFEEVIGAVGGTI